MTSVLIVDDHPVFRRAIRRAFEAAGWDVVGVAADGAEGIREARATTPDVVVLDIGLPDMSGLEVAQTLTADPDAPCVVLTSTRDPEDVEPLIPQSGARGFVPKDLITPAAIGAFAQQPPDEPTSGPV